MANVANEKTQRREIYFSGRVQGVGFRYTTRDLAARFDVAGYVRNLPDGRVQLVVEGAASTLDRFVAALEGEMNRFIHGTQCTVAPPTDEFTGFSIHH
jgi:acylphosphatase